MLLFPPAICAVDFSLRILLLQFPDDNRPSCDCFSLCRECVDAGEWGVFVGPLENAGARYENACFHGRFEACGSDQKKCVRLDTPGQMQESGHGLAAPEGCIAAEL